MADGGSEPSMEAILSSIKRIIADEAPASRSRQVVEPVTDAVPADVLELTDTVDPDVAPLPAREPLLSDEALLASRARLDALSALVVKPAARGSDTLESLVGELLRPMLAEWLDRHLPAIVDRIVAREIERIVSQS